MKPRPRRSRLASLATSAAMLVLCLTVVFQVPIAVSQAQGPATSATIEAVPPVTTATETIEKPAATEPAQASEEPTAPPGPEDSPLLVPAADEPKREADEGPILNIYEDSKKVEETFRGLGRPPFIYNPKTRPDPMVIPWIRAEIVANERIQQADSYVKEAEGSPDPQIKRDRYLKALAELDLVHKEDPTSLLGKNAQARMQKIRAALGVIPPPGTKITPTVTPLPELPPWVKTNTKGIIYDHSPQHDHLVLVGDEALPVGRVVQKYPNVRIVEITRDTVVYEYQKVRIPVKIEIDGSASAVEVQPPEGPSVIQIPGQGTESPEGAPKTEPRSGGVRLPTGLRIGIK